MPRFGGADAEKNPRSQAEFLLVSMTSALDDLDRGHGATGRPNRAESRGNENQGGEEPLDAAPGHLQSTSRHEIAGSSAQQ